MSRVFHELMTGLNEIDVFLGGDHTVYKVTPSTDVASDRDSDVPQRKPEAGPSPVTESKK